MNKFGRAMVCTAVIFFISFFTTEISAQKIDLRFMTGPMGGAWYPLGGAIANAIQKGIPGVNVAVLPGGALANSEAIDLGKSDIGFSHTTFAMDGYLGRPPFKKKLENLRQFVNLYPQYYQIVVMEDSGIKSVADLKGKIICPGPKGHASELWTQQLLQVYGLSYKDMAKVNHVGWNDAVALMKDGHAHAFLLGTTIPASSVMDLAASRKIRLVSLPDEKIKALQAINSGYLKRIVPKGTYAGVTYDAPGVGNFAHLVISAKLPEDLVYQMTRIMDDNISQFADVVKSMKGISTKDLAIDIGLPFHPGALKYFKEKGVVK